MADLLALSARFIDENLFEGVESFNRPTAQLSEVAAGIAVVEAFSHVVAFSTDDGLVLFDTSLEAFGPMIVKALRGWSSAPVDTIAYTHGHVDHVGGAQSVVDDAAERGHRRPRVVSHEAVTARFDRYALTNGYNAVINARQFGGMFGERGMSNAGTSFGPASWVAPDVTFRETYALQVGGTAFELHHARGETDDHLWAWVPSARALCAGDFITWVFPNAGNPQKVQRYPGEWARALRAMAALEPELLLPAHGLPVGGAARVRQLLEDVAAALDSLVEQTLTLMNEGARLDAILRTVSVPSALMDRPYLRPMYDEPEFVVRNVWRQFGGWYDGDPSHLKPAPDAALARELAELAGGAGKLAARGREVADQGDHRLACHLVEFAAQAAPGDAGVHAARAAVYRARRKAELSLMAKGIYRSAAEESERIAGSKS